MSKNYILIFLGLSITIQQLQAQMVSETVDFDTYVSASDNDFENRFDNGTGLTQIQTNGISGGCLQTPQTINWGNDNAVYCTRFKGVIGVSYITGICFKYDTLQFNNINFDRAASVWMKPYADPNHYAIASVMDTRRIQIVSYSASGTSAVMQLQQNHWYNLLLTTDFTGGGANDQIDINAQVNDLGVTGTDPPLPTGFTNAVLYDSVLIADTSVEVSVTGTSWGGARYLDNFRFDGMKSFDNCISTAVNDHEAEKSFSYKLENSTLTVFADATFLSGELELLNLNGQKLVTEKIISSEIMIDLSGLSSGIYFLAMKNDSRMSTQKFSIVR